MEITLIDVQLNWLNWFLFFAALLCWELTKNAWLSFLNLTDPTWESIGCLYQQFHFLHCSTLEFVPCRMQSPLINNQNLKVPFIAWNIVLKSNSILQRTYLPFSQKLVFLNWNSLHHFIQGWKATAGQVVARKRTRIREAYRRAD